MSDDDRIRWNRRHGDLVELDDDAIGLPTAFAELESAFPTHGRGLELACGRGATSLWLARRGLDVWGVDVSSEAIEQARRLAERTGLADRCAFDVYDLDRGLPPGPAVDVLVCHMYRGSGLERQMSSRLAAGGVLAVAVLSEVGGTTGNHRARAGELLDHFGHLDVLGHREGDGRAWLVARATR